MGLTLDVEPGFAEIPSSAFDASQPATAANMKGLNSNAAYGAVRDEQFWGYYKHGETVQVPVSPIDGHVYARADLMYEFSIWYTGAPPSGALNGTHTTPSMGATSGGGQILKMGFDVDQDTGLVTCMVAYYVSGGAETDTSDGILKVVTHAQRDR